MTILPPGGMVTNCGFKPLTLLNTGIFIPRHEEGDFSQLRAQLGNVIAIKAYREGKLPFPDGSIIVALHWKRVPSDEDNQVFAGSRHACRKSIASSVCSPLRRTFLSP